MRVLKNIRNKFQKVCLIDLDNFSYKNINRMKYVKEFQQKFGFSIIPLSYFEPIPDLTKVDLMDNSLPNPILNLNFKYNFSFIERNLEIILKNKIIPSFIETNPMFPVQDMAAYASFIETYKPNKIIEIGSGYSACFARLFLDYLKYNTDLICIEPDPNEHLVRLANNNRVKLIKKLVQNLNENEINEINELQENDILFIDTSHISNFNSDTNFIFLRLMPLLKKGVIVHIHDIFLPYDYERFVYYQIGNFYNEQYLLASILANSDNFECLYSSYYDFIQGLTPFVKPHRIICMPDKMRRGASIWLQKAK